ncbi:translation machinery-associated protein 20 [Diplocarpon rosae]|nr:translation machinery-associated protein 20 [Diplocarpon rosae]
MLNFIPRILSIYKPPAFQSRSVTPKTTLQMPLVVPGIMSGGEQNKTDEWTNKLVGKKLGESSDEVTFARSELPKETRIIEPGSMVTKDFKPER